MSDDIPPLIPETPPPMTKLDWEDDEDFMDFPHLALEIPSESSLSEILLSSVVVMLSSCVNNRVSRFLQALKVDGIPLTNCLMTETSSIHPVFVMNQMPKMIRLVLQMVASF